MTIQDSVNLDELRRLAEQATPGPWEWDDQYHNELKSTAVGELVLFVWGYDYEMNWRNEQADAAYIAAASPDTILRLLDRVAALEAALWLVEEIMLMTDERDDSVPLTDWLPDEWVQRADALVNERPAPAEAAAPTSGSLREALKRCISVLVDHVSWPDNGWIRMRDEAVVKARAALVAEPEGLDVDAMHRAVCQSAWLTNDAVHDPAYPGEWPCADIVARYQAEARLMRERQS